MVLKRHGPAKLSIPTCSQEFGKADARTLHSLGPLESEENRSERTWSRVHAMRLAPTTKSARIGQRAAAAAPGGRPSTLPEAPGLPGALSCAYKAAH